MSELVETKKTISDWLKNHGWKVMWDQKNREGYPTFHSQPSTKPDILIQKNNYNIMVEVKPGKKHQDLLNGMIGSSKQTGIIQYAGEYYTGRTVYTEKKPADRALDIDAFVIATKYSKNGYLYQEEEQHGYVKSSFLSKEYDLIERPITHSTTRMLWRLWEKGLASEHYNELKRGKASKKVKMPNKPKIGTLIAKINRQRQVEKEPYFFLNSNEFVPASDPYAFNR